MNYDETYNIFKNIIIKQNKDLLKRIAKDYNIDFDYLANKYIVPEYYLPIIKK